MTKYHSVIQSSEIAYKIFVFEKLISLGNTVCLKHFILEYYGII